MDFKTEFPKPNLRVREAIRHYFKTESDFMATKDFYTNRANISIRRLAVSEIATHWRGVDMDAFVPYLAMNYFDRFASRNPNLDEEVRLVAICCLTVAAKMRTKSFSLTDFLEDVFNVSSHETIMRMELCILNGLEWRMRPATPFCFLNHLYPTFFNIGGFKRRCINEIIVQAQGEDDFIEYTPSQIAYSSFLAATHIAYPSRIASFAKPEVLSNCYHRLVDLCVNKDINIEHANLGISSSSSETKTDYQKQAVVTKIEEEEMLPVSFSEIVPSAEAAPKRLMNFDVKWPIDVNRFGCTTLLSELEVPKEQRCMIG